MCRTDRLDVIRNENRRLKGISKMHSMKRRDRVVCVLAVSVSLLGGCSQDDSKLVELRRELLLDVEPDATSIALAKNSVSENPNVSIIARVFDDEQLAFINGEASFMVTEILPKAVGHDDKNHVKNCPFCKRRAAEAPRAAVRFISETGDPLSIDARELFDIGPSDTVVIQGRGELMAEVDMLQVTAHTIFVRKSGEVSN